MNRRTFVIVVVFGSSRCSSRSPLQPSAADSVISPQTGTRLLLPTGSYVRSGTATQDGTLLQTMATERPDVIATNGFVTGFDGKPFNSLVFFKNGQPFDDQSVAGKKILAGNSWGCMEYSQLLRK